MTEHQFTDHKFTVGEQVHVDPSLNDSATRGRTYRVERVNPRNIVAKPVDGAGRGINYPKMMLIPGPWPATADATRRTPAYVPSLPVGKIVRFARAQRAEHLGHFVIAAETKPNAYRLQRLGGNPDGRYFRNVAQAHLIACSVRPEHITDDNHQGR